MSCNKVGAVIASLAIAVGVLSTDAVLFSSVAHGQALDKVTQGFARGRSGEVRLTPRDNANLSTDETELLAALTGVVLVNDPAQVSESGTTASGVEARGEIAPSPVIAAAQAYIGEPVSLAQLDRMTRDMVLAFREAGLPVVNVVVPPQDISNGVIQVIAVVGHVGTVEVAGNAADPHYYSDGFPLQSGDAIEEGAVLNHLRWKSRRFHRRLDAVYSPGASFSETDLTLEVTEDKPWSVFAGFDSTGSGGTGDFRIYTGLMLGNLWGLDHELSYQFTTSEEGVDALNAHALTYTLPVWNLTDLQLTGAYVGSGTDIAGGGGRSTGESWQFGATFIQQLPRLWDWSLDARYGFEFKQSDNALEFGTVIPNGAAQVGQFFGQISGERGGSGSMTVAHLGVWLSPGGLFDDNTDVAFATLRQRATAQYAYVRAGIDHTFFLPQDFRFNIDVDGQLSSGRLLPSEMMYLGGLNSVRGFDENAVRGDHGILARLELQGPAMRIFKDGGQQDGLRGYVFTDFGAVGISGAPALTEGNAEIAGAGIGFVYQYGKNLSAEMAYGWRLSSDPLVTDNDDGQLHFRLTARF